MTELIGNFTEYTPSTPVHAGVLHVQNEDGDDWYDIIANTVLSAHSYVVVNSDVVVTSVDSDPSKLFPNGQSVYKTAQVVQIGMAVGGGVFSTPEAVQTIPHISNRQLRLWLLGSGLLSQVQPLLEQLPEPTRSSALIEWEYAVVVKRDNDLVYQLASAFGMTTSSTDQAFIDAASL